MSRRRINSDGYLAALRKPFVGYKGKIMEDPSMLVSTYGRPRIYLRKSKLPSNINGEDKENYRRLLRMLPITIKHLDDKAVSPRTKMNACLRLLAVVEMIRPDIQAMWRKEFVELLALYRLIAGKYLEQINKAESK